MIYENNENVEGSSSEKSSIDRFHIELLFSPGLYPCFLTEKEQIYEKRFNSHKNKTPQPLNGSKKSKTNSTKSSGDQSEKEDTEAPGTLQTSSSNKSSESIAQEPSTSAEPTTPIYEKTLLSKQPSPAASISPTNTQTSANKEDETEAHESDDELDHAVNLVVLGEVAGKKFSEMGKSTQPEPPPRKRHPTPELKSVLEDEAEIGRIHKNVKELGKCLSTDNEPIGDGDKQRPLKIDTSLQRAKHPNTIVKSMSDILSNRTHACADEPSIAPIDEDLLESPDSGGLVLDASQATVGSAQTWAKDAKEILSGNKNEGDSQKQPSEEGSSVNADPKLQQSSSSYQRPLLATIFSQNNESSETKSQEPEESTPAPESSEQSGGQITSQNSRDDENSNSTRRSRFPYRFKHHTVNLLTGGGVENRLISTAVLMDTVRRKNHNNPAVLSTAVIARSSSAPRLQTFKAGDVFQVAEIKRFWPPLRSLEALCNISFKQFDQFLERMLTANTPLPSPPKTPILRESEVEHNFQKRLKDTIKRLSMIESAEKKSAEKSTEKKS